MNLPQKVDYLVCYRRIIGWFSIDVSYRTFLACNEM